MNPLGDVYELNRIDELRIILVVEKLRVVGKRAAADEEHRKWVYFVVVHVDYMPNRAELLSCAFLNF